MTDPWKPYMDAARAAGEAEALVPDYGASDSLWMRVEVPELEPDPEPGGRHMTASAPHLYPSIKHPARGQALESTPRAGLISPAPRRH